MFAKVISILTIKVIFKAKDLCWELIKERKKVRKQENTHSFKKKKELAQEKENSLKKTRSRPRKRLRKKESFFLVRSLGRERVFLSEFFFFLNECVFSYFLFSFINSQPRLGGRAPHVISPPLKSMPTKNSPLSFYLSLFLLSLYFSLPLSLSPPDIWRRRVLNSIDSSPTEFTRWIACARLNSSPHKPSSSNCLEKRPASCQLFWRVWIRQGGGPGRRPI